MTSKKTRVGIVGAGTIGKAILGYIQSSDVAEVDYLLVSDAGKKRDFDIGRGVILDDAKAALAREVDLVIEAALAENARTMAPLALQHSDFCAFSCTALADPDTEAAILEVCRASGRSFYVPHGAVLALDGISDGRDLIDSITITTTKSGKSLGLPDDTSDGVVFEGSTREVCARFPRNVNVHAAIAIAGIGFDRTRSRVIAQPGLKDNIHRIEVRGQGFNWNIDASSTSLGGVTGAYTPLSAIGSIERILGRRGLTIV
jgi:aspartate dehydrogenase